VRWLIRRPRGRRSGSLVFPAPSLTLPVSRRVFEVFRRCRATIPVPKNENHERTLRPWLPYRVLTCRPGRISRPPLLGFVPTYRSSRAHNLRCEWASQTLRPARPGEVGCRDSPPPTSLPSVHSPEPTLLPTRFGPEAACLGIPFRPRGFAPPRRFPPLERPRACCIPLPVMGFAAFRAFALPATLFTPLEEFHSTAAAPRHRGRCPLAVPSPRARLFRSPPLPESTLGDPLDGSVGFEALLRRRVRDAIRPLPVGGALSFLGFVPLQGPFLRLESTRALLRSPCIGCGIRKIHRVQELRSAPARLALRGPHRPPPCGGRSGGMTASAGVRRRSPSPPGTRHRGVPKNSPTGKHRRSRSCMMSRIEALRRPKADQGRGSMRTESLRRFTESRERVSRSPGPDRSQDPGRR
jgi:hypothetical protein